MEHLQKEKDVSIYGPSSVEDRGGVITFNLKNIHPHDVSSILDREGIAIRSGHMCAMPLINTFGVESACRASFYVYNDKSDVDLLVSALNKTREVFK